MKLFYARSERKNTSSVVKYLNLKILPLRKFLTDFF